jgi:hypothetical protein
MPANVFLATAEKQIVFKTAIIEYLQGYSIDNTRKKLLLACTSEAGVQIDAKTMAQNISILDPSNTKFDEQVSAILLHLNQDPTPEDYTTKKLKSLHDLLKQENKQNLDHLIELIESIQSPTPLLDYFYVPSLAILASASFWYVLPEYFWEAIAWLGKSIEELAQWLHHNVIQLNKWPLIGMGMQIAWLVYYLRNTFQYGLEPSEEKITALTFQTIALMLNFLGHFLAFNAAGLLSWGPALCFIASSLVSVVENLYQVLCHLFRTTTDNAPSSENTHSRAVAERNQSKIDNHYKFCTYKLIHAAVVATLLITVTLLPPHLLLTIAYTLSLSLFTMLKNHCISSHKEESATRLQQTIKAIYSPIDSNRGLNLFLSHRSTPRNNIEYDFGLSTPNHKRDSNPNITQPSSTHRAQSKISGFKPKKKMTYRLGSTKCLTC